MSVHLPDILREVARRSTNTEVRDAFRMLAALIDRAEAKEEREHRQQDATAKEATRG